MLRRILYLTGVFIAASVLSGIGAGIGLPHLAKSGLSATTVLGMTALLLGFVALIASGRALVRLASGWRRLALLALLLVTTLLGVYLLAVPLASESSEHQSAAILDEARRIGRQYAIYAKEQGRSLRVTLEASMFFRDSLIETALQLPETANIRPEANVRLLRRINLLLNAVHLAVAAVYEDGETAIDSPE